jgi:hypothetical protein
MSFSKPLEGEKRKFFEFPRKDQEPKKIKVSSPKRKCSARGCDSNQDSHSLFTFPSTSRIKSGQRVKCKESTERYKIKKSVRLF